MTLSKPFNLLTMFPQLNNEGVGLDAPFPPVLKLRFYILFHVNFLIPASKVEKGTVQSRKKDCLYRDKIGEEN